MPVLLGILMSISTTSGSDSPAFGGLRAVTRLPDELEVVFLGENHLKPTPEQRMIIDDQHADGVWAPPNPSPP